VASPIVGSGGRLVGVDLAELDPPLELANTTTFVLDIGSEEAASRICETLGGLADVVLCDAAPKLTGVRATDRAKEEALLEAVAVLLPEVLRPGGGMIVKLLECPEAQAMERNWRSCFDERKVTKPKASRKGTSERYFIGRGFRLPSDSASSA